MFSVSPVALKKWGLTILPPDNVKSSVNGLELRSTNIQKARSVQLDKYLSSYNILGSGLRTEAGIKVKKTQLLLLKEIAFDRVSTSNNNTEWTECHEERTKRADGSCS